MSTIRWSWATPNLREGTGERGSVGLVIGGTGVVGMQLVEILSLPDTPGGPWKVYAISRRAQNSSACPAVESIQCDISDPYDAQAKLSPLVDVTHIFYATWAMRNSDVENVAANAAMLSNVLSAVLPSAANLRHVCLVTGRCQYLGGFDSWGNIELHDPPFHEDLPRLRCPHFYYAQEDLLFDSLRSHAKVSWSIHRPSAIFGFSPYSLSNLVQGLCVYAAVCKGEGGKLRWPGNHVNWEAFSDASDAELVAEQQIWAAVDPRGRNQAFNCSNGDVFKWKHLWTILAEQFGLEPVGYLGEEHRLKLEDAMKGQKAELWAKIVDENQLLPVRLEEAGHWPLLDAYLSTEVYLDDMNKSKELGFLSFRNTRKSFVSCIQRMKKCKIVP